MNMRALRIRRRWIPLTILAIVTVVLAFVIRDFVRQVIVLPLVYVGWFGWIVLTNLPYWVFWIILLGAVAAIALASLKREAKAHRPAPPPDSLPQGPVTTWYRLFAQAHRSSTARRRLSRSLGQVLWRVRYPDLPYNDAVFARHADDEALTLSPEMRAYFSAGLQRDTTVTRGLFRRSHSQGPLDLPADAAVRYLEDALNPSRLE